MKNRKTLICLLLAVLLLSGCTAAENLPKPPTFTTPPDAVPSPPPTADVSVPPAPSEAPAPPEEVPPPPPAPPAETAAEEESENGYYVHLEQQIREVFDPAEGKNKILEFSWDSVQVLSDDYPQAAEKMTETLAEMEDAWYTGGSVEEGGDYGYNAMLEAAEDNYAIALEYGAPMELEASRSVYTEHADSDYCVFLINTYYYMGGAHGSYGTEAVCFDAQTGERLTLDSLSSDPEAFRVRLVEEMLKLAGEDRDGYYSDSLSLTEPDRYAEAFAALLREGSWYPGQDAFHLFSDIYELGPYASGMTDFPIPYEHISDLLDARWIPQQSEEEAKLRLVPVAEVPEGSVEIADLLVIGDGGEAFLLACEGRLTDLRIQTCSWYEDRVYPEKEIYYCGRLTDAAIQLALMMEGDLPGHMINYCDAKGEHTLLIGMSGEDGSFLLTEEK